MDSLTMKSDKMSQSNNGLNSSIHSAQAALQGVYKLLQTY